MGVHITACKASTDQLGVTEDLEKLNIEIKYWGEPLTEILKTMNLPAASGGVSEGKRDII